MLEIYDWSQDWTLDSSRIRNELGYEEFVPAGEAMRRTVAWEKVNPPDIVPEEHFDYATEDAAVAAPTRN